MQKERDNLIIFILTENEALVNLVSLGLISFFWHLLLTLMNFLVFDNRKLYCLGCNFSKNNQNKNRNYDEHTHYIRLRYLSNTK